MEIMILGAVADGRTREPKKELKNKVSASAAASMKTVVVRFADADADAAADAAAYYITTADFIGVSRRTRRSDAASDAASCVNESNKS
ncbi:hypothetical protein YC2023_114870 [Brassica napus]